MVCGTPVARREERPQRAPHADPETLSFLRAIISRPATFTFVFLVANVFLYILMYLSGGATGEVLRAYGAKVNYLIDQEGQWWRFVTPIFLHVQLPPQWVGTGPLSPLLSHMHLLANMCGLFILGPYVEKLYGSARFVVFWTLTGIAGVVASYLSVRPELAHGALGEFLFKRYDSPSAGASGALFGLMGVLLVCGVKYRRELPDDLGFAYKYGLLPTLALNLFVGYVWRDRLPNAAHLGGLFAGVLLGLVVGYQRPGTRGRVAHAWHAAQAACLALIVLSFVMAARHLAAPPPRLSNPKPSAPAPDSRQSFIDSVNAGQGAFVRFLKGDPDGLVPAIEQLEQSPALSPEADSLRADLRGLLARALAASNDESADARAREQRAAKLSKEFAAWQKSLEQWINDEAGGKLNMQKPEEPARENK